MYQISNSIFCFACIHHVEWLTSSLLLKESVMLQDIFLILSNYNFILYPLHFLPILS